MIQFRWRNLGSDISQIDYEVAAIPLLCRKLGVKDVREHQAELITRVQMWKIRSASVSGWKTIMIRF